MLVIPPLRKRLSDLCQNLFLLSEPRHHQKVCQYLSVYQSVHFIDGNLHMNIKPKRNGPLPVVDGPENIPVLLYGP